MTAALAEPLTPEWHEQRRRGIGASEIAAVMGISPWESPFSIFWRKLNGWNLDLSAEMEWGTRLEEAIAAKYADSHSGDILRKSSLVVGPEAWMLATPDRLIGRMRFERPEAWNHGPLHFEPFGVLELKTAHSAHDGWGEPDTDDIPVWYRCQVQWQMLCVGVDDAVVAALIGGSDYREYHVRRDDKDIAVMVEHGRRFMARLESGDPPPLDDHHATVDTLKRLHPDLEDTTVEVPPDIAAGYLRAVAMRRKVEALEDKYEALLRAEMGGARRATSGGRKVATHVITDVAAETKPRGPHRKDYLLAALPRGKKT